MAEDLPTEEANASEFVPRKPELSNSPTFASPNISTDMQTEGREDSPNESGPSTPTHEHLPSGQTTDSIHGTIFRPYAIEEPDDELAPTARRLELPCLPDYFEHWQRELMESIHDLGNERTKARHLKVSQSQGRGLKRKSTNSVITGDAQYSTSCQSKSKTRTDDTPLHVPGLSSKRLRRRSRQPGDIVSLHDIREARGDESSSSDLDSTGTSSPDTMDESAIAEEMDID